MWTKRKTMTLTGAAKGMGGGVAIARRLAIANIGNRLNLKRRTK
jgi:hypothetical protein